MCGRSFRFMPAIAAMAVGLFVSGRLRAQSPEAETIQAASAVLNEALATPGNRIPQSMLANAHGVAVIPRVIQ